MSVIEPPHTGLTRTRDGPRSQRARADKHRTKLAARAAHSARERASSTRRGTEAGLGTLSRARSSRTALTGGSFPVSARRRKPAVFKICMTLLPRVGQRVKLYKN